MAEANGTVTGPCVNFINNVSLARCACWEVCSFCRESWDWGTCPALSSIPGSFPGPINEVANIIAELQSAFAAAERVFSLIDAEPEASDAVGAKELTKVRGDVELRHVDFGYEPGKPIIQDLSFHAKPGSLTAIVGPTAQAKQPLSTF